MKHRARWAALAVAVVVVALAVVLALNVGSDPEGDARRSLLLGRAAPAFDLPTLDGARVGSEALAGKSVIVNFWNTWCIPCREELPVFEQFYAQHAVDADLAIVGIVRDDSTAAVRSYVDAWDIAWTVALDPGNRAALDFATRGQPETYAISPSGQIVGTQYGPMTLSGLEAMLRVARGTG